MEGDIATVLTTIQNAYPEVTIGSYVNHVQASLPLDQRTHNVQVTLQSRNLSQLVAALEQVTTSIRGWVETPLSISC